MHRVNSTTHTRTTRSLAAGLGALALAASLAACGSSGSSGSSGAAGSSGHDGHQMPMGTSSTAAAQAGSHNDADVSFATMMIPHHEQAVAMADLATTRATTDGVKQLAAQVAAAQEPEIRTMSGWLAAWGAPVPSGSASGMAGHDTGDMGGHETGSMPGMMSAQEMADLAGASGTAFDRMWLQMMVRHHEGAVAMARTEQAQGASAEAKALAASIASSQTAEIERMQGLLAALPA